MEVNADLYDFLKENETGITQDENGVVVYAHIPFYKLDDFVEIIGQDWFAEGGLEALLFNESLCVELNDIIEGQGHKVISYKKCFDDYDLRRYEKQLIDMP